MIALDDRRVDDPAPVAGRTRTAAPSIPSRTSSGAAADEACLERGALDRRPSPSRCARLVTVASTTRPPAIQRVGSPTPPVRHGCPAAHGPAASSPAWASSFDAAAHVRAAATAATARGSTSPEPRDEVVLLEEPRVQVAAPERGVGDDRGQQVEVGGEPLQPGPVQRVGHGVDRGVAIRRMDDELRHERVVERRHGDAGRDPRVDADVVRDVERRHAAGRRQEPGGRVLRDDSDLDRVARRGGRRPA